MEENQTYRLKVNLILHAAFHHTYVTLAGAGHGDELSYLFTQPRQPKIEPDSSRDVAVKRLTKIWTNFAKYGKPFPEEEMLLEGTWKPVVKGEINYVDINEELSTGVNPDAERVAFWEKLYEDYPAAKYW